MAASTREADGPHQPCRRSSRFGYNRSMPFDRRLLEARLALDLVASADMPSIAWDAIEAGLDGPATRRLGAYDRPTYFEIVHLMPLVRQELELSEITVGEAALRLASDIANEILRSGDDPLLHVRDFSALWIRSQYAREIRLVGNLWDDVYVAEAKGQSEDEIRKWVTSRLQDVAGF